MKAILIKVEEKEPIKNLRIQKSTKDITNLAPMKTINNFELIPHTQKNKSKIHFRSFSTKQKSVKRVFLGYNKIETKEKLTKNIKKFDLQSWIFNVW